MSTDSVAAAAAAVTIVPSPAEVLASMSREDAIVALERILNGIPPM